MSLRVLKFGGTSVGTPETLAVALDLLLASRRDGPTVGVVSAFSGATSELERYTVDAAAGAVPHAALAALETRHLSAIERLAPGEAGHEARQSLDGTFRELRATLWRIGATGQCPAEIRDRVMSLGERLSAPIVAAGLRARGASATVWDGGDVVRTDSRAVEAHVDQAVTRTLLRQRLAAESAMIPIVTGFIGSDATGRTTLLGRGGSDYTAAIVGAALDASCVEIWTDVDGVLTADPRLVSGARPLDRLTFAEAAELSWLGAKVLHPNTVQPLVDQGIPVIVRNTFNPGGAGTTIGAVAPDQGSVHVVTSVGGLTELSFAPVPADAVHEIAAHVRAWLSARGEPAFPAVGSQASATLTMAVRASAVGAWLGELVADLRERGLAGLGARVVEHRGVVSAVGHGVLARVGQGAVLAAALADAGIAHGQVAASHTGLSIGAIVAEDDLTGAVRAVHAVLVEGAGCAADVALAC